MNKLMKQLTALAGVIAICFGVYFHFENRYALAEDVKSLRQTDYCLMKELRLISIRNDIRDYNQTYGKDCLRCDDKQKDDYGILLEEKEIQRKLMEVCR